MTRIWSWFSAIQSKIWTVSHANELSWAITRSKSIVLVIHWQTISGWMLIRWMLQASSLDARKHPDFRKIRIQTGDKHPKGNLGILHSGHYKCNFKLHTRFLLHKQQFLVFCFTFLPKILALFFIFLVANLAFGCLSAFWILICIWILISIQDAW